MATISVKWPMNNCHKLIKPASFELEVHCAVGASIHKQFDQVDLPSFQMNIKALPIGFCPFSNKATIRLSVRISPNNFYFRISAIYQVTSWPVISSRIFCSSIQTRFQPKKLTCTLNWPRTYWSEWHACLSTSTLPQLCVRQSRNRDTRSSMLLFHPWPFYLPEQ